MSCGKFYFRPAEGEHIEAILSLAPEKSGAIHGIVRDISGKNVEGALVSLFDGEDGPLISLMFTGEDGHFQFGPLAAGKLYMVRVHKSDLKFRELEIRAE